MSGGTAYKTFKDTRKLPLYTNRHLSWLVESLHFQIVCHGYQSSTLWGWLKLGIAEWWNRSKHISGTLGDIQLQEGLHGAVRTVPADQAELIDWMLGDVAGLLQEVVCMLSTRGEA